MSRNIIRVTLLAFVLLITALPIAFGCSNGDTFADPLYINEGDNPFDTPERFVTSIVIEPAGVNIAIGGLQQFKATLYYNDGTNEVGTQRVEWYTENPAIGSFEPITGKYLAQNPGVAVVRARFNLGNGMVHSNASFVNAFNPNQDLPPAVPLNPMISATDEGALVSWDMNKTDGDIAGYNLWRTQVSVAHYATDFGKVNEYPILYPSYLDQSVVSGWYYYRVTAQDLIGLNSAPSEEVAVFITGTTHYGTAWD